jgi:hypothetical protein
MPILAHYVVPASVKERRLKQAQRAGSAEEGRAGQPEFCLVMPRAERSLFDIISRERWIGRNVKAIAKLLDDLLGGAAFLHSKGFVHGDIKPRNVLRLFDSSVVLTDFDAVARIGQDCVGLKTSTAYIAPELAKPLFFSFAGKSQYPVAEPSFDVWGFGAVAFELFTGNPLFGRDLSDDNIQGCKGQLELANWLSLSDEQLDQVLHMAPGLHADIKAAASHLLSWCLRGDPKARPTIQEIKRHKLFHMCRSGRTSPSGQPELQWDDVRVLFHLFISHFQTEAADIVKVLCLETESLQCRAWIDMRADEITEPAMRQGVIDSEVFLLVLTRNALFRPFCIKEINWGIEFGKPFVVVVEKDGRFASWDYASWSEQWQKGGSSGDYDWLLSSSSPLGGTGATRQAMLDAVAKMVEDNKGAMLPYRRRNFEVGAMFNEMFARSSLVCPPKARERPASSVAKAGGAAREPVLIFRESSTGGGVAAALLDAMAARGVPAVVVEGADQFDSVLKASTSRVTALLVVSAGVLEKQRDLLMRVMQCDDAKVVAVHNNWHFYGPEQNGAPDELKAIFDSELLTYRPADTPNLRYEFEGSMDEILRRLGQSAGSSPRNPISGGAGGAGGAGLPTVAAAAPTDLQGVQAQLDEKQAKLGQHMKQAAHLQAQLEGEIRQLKEQAASLSQALR